MDVEALIDAVFVRPAIWDRNDKRRSNRQVVDKCWADIQAELNVEEMLLRRKWKYLRDQFASEWGKIETLGANSCQVVTSKWQFYKQLLFLKGVAKPRTYKVVPHGEWDSTRGGEPGRDSSRDWEDSLRSEVNAGAVNNDNSNSNAGEPSYVVAVSDTSENGEEDGDTRATTHARDTHDTRESQHTSTLYVRGKRKRKRKRLGNATGEGNEFHPASLANIYDSLETIIHNTNPSSRNVGPTEDDDDLLFLKSLLPHIKGIPMPKRLCFRGRLLELVQEFAYPPPEDQKFLVS
ncbi:uncharacterized protein LOC101862916 [Aplysia californica]|uniref:Uncharacterized protein LOC101862916 n=1 Tax=Aplysia californica TaxID=6500 RepID=A0ABM0K959_APLCA|nr:uncharacterized protein LOC101862916 [Aplysia californica]